MLLRAASDGRECALEPVEDEQAGLASLQGERRVEHVGRGQAEVEPAPVVPELFGDGIHERGEVVVRPLLDLGDALRCRRSRPLADARDRVGRNRPDLAPAFERGQLDLEPAGEPALVRPDLLHGRAGVARDHRFDSRARGGRPGGKPTGSCVRIVSVAMVSRKKVLVIEDERPIAEPLADALRREGFDVHLAATAADGLEAFSAQAPDIVLLDVMLPDGDGRDVLRQIRQVSRTPVVMVSARGEEMDRVLGLELGADDYVTKPFSAAELVARMRAVLRRSTAEPADVSGGALASGDVAMNLDTRTVTRDGEAVELTVKEFELLRVLLEKRRPAGEARRPRLGGLGPELVRLDEDARRPRQLAAQEARRRSRRASLHPHRSRRRLSLLVRGRAASRELPHPPRPRGRLPRRRGRPRARDPARAQHRAEGGRRFPDGRARPGRAPRRPDLRRGGGGEPGNRRTRAPAR